MVRRNHQSVKESSMAGKKGRSGRKPSDNPKVQVGIRMDPDLLAAVKAKQPKRKLIDKIEAALRAWLKSPS